MREPIGKAPCLVQQRLEEMATMFVRLTCKADRTDVIEPRLEVGLFWFGGSIPDPRHHDLRGAREGKQRLPATDADGLENR